MRSRILWAMALVAAFAISGCGGSSGGDSATKTVRAIVLSPKGAPAGFVPGAGGTVLAKGTQQQLSAKVVYTDGTTADTPSGLFWQSSSANADVDPSGLVTAVSAGTATINAIAGAVKSNNQPVTVTNAILTAIGLGIPGYPWAISNGTSANVITLFGGRLPNSASGVAITGDIPVGTAVPLRAIARFDDGSFQDLTSQVTWESDHASVLVTNVTLTAPPLPNPGHPEAIPPGWAIAVSPSPAAAIAGAYPGAHITANVMLNGVNYNSYPTPTANTCSANGTSSPASGTFECAKGMRVTLNAVAATPSSVAVYALRNGNIACAANCTTPGTEGHVSAAELSAGGPLVLAAGTSQQVTAVGSFTGTFQTPAPTGNASFAPCDGSATLCKQDLTPLAAAFGSDDETCATVSQSGQVSAALAATDSRPKCTANITATGPFVSGQDSSGFQVNSGTWNATALPVEVHASIPTKAIPWYITVHQAATTTPSVLQKNSAVLPSTEKPQQFSAVLHWTDANNKVTGTSPGGATLIGVSIGAGVQDVTDQVAWTSSTASARTNSPLSSQVVPGFMRSGSLGGPAGPSLITAALGPLSGVHLALVGGETVTALKGENPCDPGLVLGAACIAGGEFNSAGKGNLQATAWVTTSSGQVLNVTANAAWAGVLTGATGYWGTQDASTLSGGPGGFITSTGGSAGNTLVLTPSLSDDGTGQPTTSGTSVTNVTKAATTVTY